MTNLFRNHLNARPQTSITIINTCEEEKRFYPAEDVDYYFECLKKELETLTWYNSFVSTKIGYKVQNADQFHGVALLARAILGEKTP